MLTCCCSEKGTLQSLTSFFSISRSNLSTDRRLLWQQLINLRLSIQGPWLAAGSYGGFEETRSRSLGRWINERLHWLLPMFELSTRQHYYSGSSIRPTKFILFCYLRNSFKTDLGEIFYNWSLAALPGTFSVNCLISPLVRLLDPVLTEGRASLVHSVSHRQGLLRILLHVKDL